MRKGKPHGACEYSPRPRVARGPRKAVCISSALKTKRAPISSGHTCGHAADPGDSGLGRAGRTPFIKRRVSPPRPCSCGHGSPCSCESCRKVPHTNPRGHANPQSSDSGTVGSDCGPTVRTLRSCSPVSGRRTPALRAQNLSDSGSHSTGVRLPQFRSPVVTAPHSGSICTGVRFLLHRTHWQCSAWGAPFHSLLRARRGVVATARLPISEFACMLLEAKLPHRYLHRAVECCTMPSAR